MFLNWDINYEFKSQYPGSLSLMFEIPIKGNRNVYMSCCLYTPSDTFLVILDTQRFIQAWYMSEDDDRFPGLHQGTERLWRADKKFHYAEDGFNEDKINPVPVADSISCEKIDSQLNITFGDGVTRTIWLLANHAEYMPLLVESVSQAELFSFFSGRESCAIYPIQGLYEHWVAEHSLKNGWPALDFLQ